MKAFIFAAGYGNRLRPVTENMPKSLLPVLNLPAICYAVFLLKEAGIDHIICNLHYRCNDIIDFFNANNNFGMQVKFSIENTILGTGGGLKKCEDIIGDSEVMLLNADVIFDLDLKLLEAYHSEGRHAATLVLYKTDKAEDIGPVSVDGNRIVDFKNFLGTDKKSEYIYTGAGIVSPLIFRYLSNEFSSIVYTGYVELIRNHSIGFYEYSGYWHDIGTVESYWKSNIDLIKQHDRLYERIFPALGIGPEIISHDSDVGENTRINDSIIGKGALIGGGAVIERSVILPGAVVKDGSEIRDSVVYNDTIIRVDQ